MSSTLSDEGLRILLRPYKMDPDAILCDQIRTYIDVLLQWNEKISLTTIEEPTDIVRFHFGESFFAVPSRGIKGGRLADLGSGAGFPGLPLKLACPDLEVTLIEANRKKATFLAEVCRRLDLSGVNILRDRVEDVPDEHLYDLVTERAVGSIDGCLNWARHHLVPAGRVILWLGLDDAKQTTRGFPTWRWTPPENIPGSDRRVLLTGRR
jgi:16S rRNA (guanine527-N7)-methyltransferase